METATACDSRECDKARLSTLPAWLLTASLATAACGGGDAVGGGLVASDRCSGRCAIALDTVAILGAPSDSIWPMWMASAVRAANGNFYVGVSDHPGTLLIYDTHGTLTGTFGRRGEGPGEYSSILMKMVRGPGDTISVVEVMRNRRVLIDSSGSSIRSHPVPFQFHGMIHLGGRMLVQADIRTPEKVGWMLHELAGDGSVGESYAELSVYRNAEVDGIRPVAAAIDGGVWLATPSRYEITKYDSELNPVRSIAPATRWFPPNDGMIGDTYTEPQPWIADISETPDSLLWVIVRVADADWEPGVLAEAQQASLRTFSLMFDWVIEVIDLQRDTRIASFRHRDPLMFGMGDGLLYGMSEDSNARIEITAFHPRVTREIR